MIASIHQPSTKTFELFSKVMLLSQGKTCYFGTTKDIKPFFESIGMAIVGHVNPAEHILDITNVDFTKCHMEDQARLDNIFESWGISQQSRQLEYNIDQLAGTCLRIGESTSRPSMPSQVVTLLHRAFIKSYRDVVAYWIRLAMYMGLAMMMGTVWLRLDTDQRSIQAFVNAIVSHDPGDDVEQSQAE